jgi:hypothetical protein
MGPRNAYKDMLDNVVSLIACVSMNHQNQLEQMANEAMFSTLIVVFFFSLFSLLVFFSNKFTHTQSHILNLVFTITHLHIYNHILHH